MNKIENKEMSLRGAVGDVAISCDKALSLRGGLMSDEAIFQAVLKMVQRLLSRCCKNVEDCRVSAMHFLAMTIPTLAIVVVLSMRLISESRAATIIDHDCDCGVADSSAGKSASDCCWQLISETDDDGNETRTLKIYAAEGKSNVAMKDYVFESPGGPLPNGYTLSNYGTSARWAKQGITAVEFEGISRIGNAAFVGEELIRNVEMSDVTEIGGLAFLYATGIKSIDIPNVTSVGNAAFYGPNLDYVGYDPTKLTSTSNIFVSSLTCSQDLTTGYMSCGSCGDKYVKSGVGCVTAENCGSGFTANATTKQCVAAPQLTESDCYANGQVFYQNACVDEYPFAKKRWTPAEANQWLYDEDNTVIMTFKVNR